MYENTEEIHMNSETKEYISSKTKNGALIIFRTILHCLFVNNFLASLLCRIYSFLRSSIQSISHFFKLSTGVRNSSRVTLLAEKVCAMHP